MRTRHWLLGIFIGMLLTPPVVMAVVPALRATGLQVSSQTSCPIATNTSGVWNNAGVWKIRNASNTDSPIVNGTPSATGDIPYSTSGGSAMSFLADVAAGAFLMSNGVAAAPIWSTLIMPNAATTGDLFAATSSNTMGRISAPAAGQVLVSTGVGTLPAWVGLPLLTAPNGSTATGHGMITIYSDATTTGTSTSVTVSDTYALPAHTLGANGQRLHVFAQWAHTAGTSNNCQNNISFNATTTGSISGAVASESYSLEVIYKRVSSSTIQWTSYARANASLADNGGQLTGLNLDTTNYNIASNMLATTATGDCTFAGLDIDVLSN